MLLLKQLRQPRALGLVLTGIWSWTLQLLIDIETFYTIFAMCKLFASTSRKMHAKNWSICYFFSPLRSCKIHSSWPSKTENIPSSVHAEYFRKNHYKNPLVILVNSRITYTVQNSESGFSDDSRCCPCLS